MLRLVGFIGAAERHRYLDALAADMLCGACEPAAALAELYELSMPWMRHEIDRRVRRSGCLDPHSIEHWMWIEWHQAIERFDPERVDTFPAFVAMRLRMALLQAARDDDPLPRRARARLQLFERTESALVNDLGRQLTKAERAELAGDILGDVDPRSFALARLVELPHEVSGSELGPADEVERNWLADAVRDAIRHQPSVPQALLDWLHHPSAHSREPSRRALTISTRMRDALAPLAEHAFG